MDVDIQEFLVKPREDMDLDRKVTKTSLSELGSKELKNKLNQQVKEFAKLQNLLYAENRQSLLIVFQGMDAAGKDSTIKRVASGVNPQGLRVYNFTAPTSIELTRSFLHRHYRELPQRGSIVIFNRSHYEEVVVVRVHPELLEHRHISPSDVTSTFWEERFEDIRSFELHLARNGTKVIKLFLHISRDVQRKRIHKRLNDPAKFWKFDPSDVKERLLWDEYQRAYELALSATSVEHAPWYVVPADHKPSMRVFVAEIIIQTLAGMNPGLPTLSEDQERVIEHYRDQAAETD